MGVGCVSSLGWLGGELALLGLRVIGEWPAMAIVIWFHMFCCSGYKTLHLKVFVAQNRKWPAMAI